MTLTLKRIYLGDTYTIGKLYINNNYFCDTIEDRVRNLPIESKVYGETAIPYGTYKVIVNYSPKFNRNLPLLLNVPYFEGIRMHRGNTAKDSFGCVILGENKIKGMVINSTKYELELTNILQNTKEEITINII